MDFKCEICSEQAGSFAALHRHLKKAHSILPKEYYPLWYNRRDKFDNELIEFRDIKSYFKTDFNSKYNFLKWIAPGGEEVKEYVLNILKERAEEKGTNVIPANVELKSLIAPSLSDYISIFGGANNFQASLKEKGLKMKLGVAAPQMKDGELKVFIDTREQTPLSFANSEVKKLIVGDYCPNDSFFCNLFVERKSIFDLAGTLTKGIDRFCREIERAGELGSYLVVVTECSFVDCQDFSPRNSFSQRIGGAYLFNKIRKLMLDYDNIQFLFSSTRARSTQLIETIFRMGEAAKAADLEYLKDIRAI